MEYNKNMKIHPSLLAVRLDEMSPAIESIISPLIESIHFDI
jgi:pentose-5-phosphate-3-epimerase